MPANITNPRLIYLKALLFLAGGVLASVLILFEHPSWRMALLLAAAVWCFARAYYFVFYVIEHYVDSSYRFSGLGSFMIYLLRGRPPGAAPPREPPAESPPRNTSPR